MNPFRRLSAFGVIGVVVVAKRHGRQVVVRMPADEGIRSKGEVQLEFESPVLEFKTRDGRLKAADGAPKAIADALRRVPNSTRWNSVRGEAGPGGITVEREGVKQGDWLLDLWLAERLADTVP